MLPHWSLERDVDRVRVVGVLSICNETENVLAEPLDVFPLLGESAFASEPKGVAVDGDGCFGGLLGEGLELREGFWIPALDSSRDPGAAWTLADVACMKRVH